MLNNKLLSTASDFLSLMDIKDSSNNADMEMRNNLESLSNNLTGLKNLLCDN